MDFNDAEAEAFLRQYQQAFEAITHIHIVEQLPEGYLDRMLGEGPLASRLRERHGLETKEELKRLFCGVPGGISRIRHIADRIIETAPKPIQDKLRSLPVGYLPTADLNAQPVTHPNGSTIIVLHSGTKSLLYFLISAFLGTIPTPQSGPQWTITDAGVWITQALTLTALGEPYFGIEKPPSFDDPYRMTAYSDFEDNICAFILGHEYAHILLEHGKALSAVALGPRGDDGQPPLQFLLRGREQELEADLIGVELALLPPSSVPGADPQMVYLAVVFFLHVLSMLELFRIGASVTQHPAPSTRRLAFDLAFRDRCDSAMKAEIAVVDQFFAFIEPRLKKAIQELLPAAAKARSSAHPE